MVEGAARVKESNEVRKIIGEENFMVSGLFSLKG